ncbi:hypothetical protein DK261_23240 [Pseudomonas sp. RW409]|nr:hypothetical protein DK261_23240 [Pseudomonas sp. RW409]
MGRFVLNTMLAGARDFVAYGPRASEVVGLESSLHFCDALWHVRRLECAQKQQSEQLKRRRACTDQQPEERDTTGLRPKAIGQCLHDHVLRQGTRMAPFVATVW